LLMLQLQSDMPNLHEGDHRLMTSTSVWQCVRRVTSLDEETVEKVNKLVMADPRLSVGFIAESVGFSTGRVCLTLQENLLVNRVSARSVPQMLSNVQ